MNPTAPVAEAQRLPDKSPDAFRTISEVADELDLPQHVLRFWETRFPQIKPLKRGGGRRYYRPQDVDLLKGIRHMLYGQGYTIKGVQRILKERGPRFVGGVGRGEQHAAPPPYQAEPEDQEFAFGEEDRILDGAAEHAPGAEAPVPAISVNDLGLLREALEELEECDRLLRSLEAPPSEDG
jgi:DNA-binding transcriptional MerR regulator